jgi:hypothetical protein
MLFIPFTVTFPGKSVKFDLGGIMAIELGDLEQHLGLDLSDLQGARAEVVNSLATGEPEANDLMAGYRRMAEVYVDRVAGSQGPGAQIALIVHMAILRAEAGDDAAYTEELQDALMYAENMDLDVAVAAIDRALKFDPSA